MAKRRKTSEITVSNVHYDGLVGNIATLLEESRRSAARAINSILTATYWEIGRRIVEFEQGGAARAEYGERVVPRLSRDLTARFGRGFSERNLWKMKDFYLGWEILPTPSAEFEARVKLPAGLLESVDEEVRIPSKTMANVQSPSAESCGHLFSAFPLSWSHYVRLMAVEKPHARAFYEAEAIRGGWSVRQLDRQIGTQFFERTANSKRQAALWARGRKPKPEDAVSVEDEVRDPYLLEFLNLSDEYTYAKKHLTEPGESDPVGIILCSGKDDAVVEYAMGGINARVFASKYLTQLPDEETLRNEIETTRRALLHRLASKNAGNERRGDTEKK